MEAKKYDIGDVVAFKPRDPNSKISLEPIPAYIQAISISASFTGITRVYTVSDGKMPTAYYITETQLSDGGGISDWPLDTPEKRENVYRVFEIASAIKAVYKSDVAEWGSHNPAPLIMPSFEYGEK